MWAATWLLLIGVVLVADNVHDPQRSWWCMLGYLCLFFVPALIIDAAERGVR
jgi:hypothetical protein